MAINETTGGRGVTMVGECGECNSIDLHYSDAVFESESVYYGFKCNDCGAEGEEWYSLEYTETIMVGEEGV